MASESDELLRLRAEVQGLRRENEALRRATSGSAEAAIDAAARVQLLASVVGKLPVILFRYDTDGTVLESVGAGLGRIGLADHETEKSNLFEAYPNRVRELRAALAGETVHYESGREASEDWAYLVCLTFDAVRGSGAIGFAIDITDRKQAERELRERARVLTSVLDGMDEGVIAAGRMGEPLFHNDAARRLLGADPVKFSAGQWPPGFGIFLADGSTPCPVDELPLSRAIAGESANGTELVVRQAPPRGATAEPRQARIACSGRPLYDDDGHLQGGVIVFRDLTEQRRLEAERVVLERQVHDTQKLESLGVLAGGIAHDFNNLLVGVLGNAGLVRWKLPPDSEILPMVQRIERSAERAADLCSQLLAYAGRGRFEVAPIHLSALVRQLASLVERSVSKRAIIEYRCDDELPVVEADPKQLQQVVMNLITNASEAIGDAEGRITVRTGVAESVADAPIESHLGEPLAIGRYAFVEVQDTGCGMDDDTQARMFDPFFSTKFTGRGLGMAAVQGIVRSHGGGLEVRSLVGEGTTVRVCLPVLDAAFAREASGSTPIPHKSEAETRTILVVDDEPDVRGVAKAILESYGFRVLVAADGRAAVAVFTEHGASIDAVLLDMMMPNMDGAETFTALRALDPNVRVLLTSGYDELEATQRFAGQGLAGFIHKPYRPSRLAERIREVLAGDTEL